MARVIDYAWGRPSVAALKAAGAVAVCRYLSYDRTGKNLTRGEADILRAAGIAPVSNWEQAGNWAEYSGGRPTGATHAEEAQRQHLTCGGPPRRPIYFSADWQVSQAELPTVADYYRGVNAVIGLGRTGAYGGFSTIKYLFDVGVITWGWQAAAWSGGRWDPRAQLRQVRNGVPIGGVDCDLNDTQAADFGQWTLPGGTGPAVSIDDIVPATGGRTVGVVLSDLWNGEQNTSSGFGPGQTARQALLAHVDKDAAGTAALAAVVALTATVNTMQAAPAVTAAQIEHLVTAITDRLVAAGVAGLSPGDRDKVRGDILEMSKRALREGTGPAA